MSEITGVRKRRIAIATVLLGFGIGADLFFQRVDLSVPASVSNVDIQHDTVAFEFPESLPHGVLRHAQSSHVLLVMGVLSALAELGVLRRRTA